MTEDKRNLPEPGETRVYKIPKGGEPEEVKKVHDLIGNVEGLKLKYAELEKEALVQEYRRINTDFDLAMRMQNNLMAIAGVLVEKHKISDEEYRKLRE
jgi:hypothetical protein